VLFENGGEVQSLGDNGVGSRLENSWGECVAQTGLPGVIRVLVILVEEIVGNKPNPLEAAMLEVPVNFEGELWDLGAKRIQDFRLERFEKREHPDAR
jgi:hypothetical protein